MCVTELLGEPSLVFSRANPVSHEVVFAVRLRDQSTEEMKCVWLRLLEPQLGAQVRFRYCMSRAVLRGQVSAMEGSCT